MSNAALKRGGGGGGKGGGGGGGKDGRVGRSRKGMSVGPLQLPRFPPMFPRCTDQTPQASISSVQADNTNLGLGKIVSWNMAVCDLNGILGGAHFTVTGTVSPPLWLASPGCSWKILVMLFWIGLDGVRYLRLRRYEGPEPQDVPVAAPYLQTFHFPKHMPASVGRLIRRFREVVFPFSGPWGISRRYVFSRLFLI